MDFCEDCTQMSTRWVFEYIQFEFWFEARNFDNGSEFLLDRNKSVRMCGAPIGDGGNTSNTSFGSFVLISAFSLDEGMARYNNYNIVCNRSTHSICRPQNLSELGGHRWLLHSEQRVQLSTMEQEALSWYNLTAENNISAKNVNSLDAIFNPKSWRTWRNAWMSSIIPCSSLEHSTKSWSHHRMILTSFWNFSPSTAWTWFLLSLSPWRKLLDE